MTSQSDATNQNSRPRNVSGTPSGQRNPSDVNSNLLASSLHNVDERQRSNSSLSLVEQALAEEGVPQDDSLLATVESELGDSLNFSKDQLEGAARDIILEFEREAGTKIESPPIMMRPFVSKENEASSDRLPIPYGHENGQNFDERPDRTSYI